MPYVYMLKCKDDTLYTGYTVDMEQRLKQHQEGTGCRYTRGRTPVELVYLESCPTKSEAMKREAIIKKMTKQEKITLTQTFPPG